MDKQLESWIRAYNASRNRVSRDSERAKITPEQVKKYMRVDSYVIISTLQMLCEDGTPTVLCLNTEDDKIVYDVSGRRRTMHLESFGYRLRNLEKELGESGGREVWVFEESPFARVRNSI